MPEQMNIVAKPPGWIYHILKDGRSYCGVGRMADLFGGGETGIDSGFA